MQAGLKCIFGLSDHFQFEVFVEQALFFGHSSNKEAVIIGVVWCMVSAFAEFSCNVAPVVL